MSIESTNCHLLIAQYWQHSFSTIPLDDSWLGAYGLIVVCICRCLHYSMHSSPPGLVTLDVVFCWMWSFDSSTLASINTLIQLYVYVTRLGARALGIGTSRQNFVQIRLTLILKTTIYIPDTTTRMDVKVNPGSGNNGGSTPPLLLWLNPNLEMLYSCVIRMILLSAIIFLMSIRSCLDHDNGLKEFLTSVHRRVLFRNPKSASLQIFFV